MERWTPATGATALREEFGADTALDLLASLLSGEVGPTEFGTEPWAMALAYIGDERVGPILARALEDHHWRVRMTATQTIGRLRIRGLGDELLVLLDDERGRVRDVAALALERTAN